jgi:hypothetical protein
MVHLLIINSASDPKNDIMSGVLYRVGSGDAPNLYLIGTTNRKQAIDEAITRAGRVSATVYFGRLGSSDRERLLRQEWRKAGLTLSALVDSAFLAKILRQTQNFTGARGPTQWTVVAECMCSRLSVPRALLQAPQFASSSLTCDPLLRRAAGLFPSWSCNACSRTPFATSRCQETTARFV